MGLSINTNVKGTSQVTTLAEAFVLMSKSLIKTAGGIENFTKDQKKMFDWLNKMAASGGKYTEVLDDQARAMREMSGETRKTQQEMAKLAGMKMIKGPFSQMSVGASQLRVDLLEVNKEIRKINENNAIRLSSTAGTEATTQAKAALALQKQLDAELEKQAVLYAKIARIKESDKSENVTKAAANLKEAASMTAFYKNELERLTAAKDKAKIATNGLTASYGKVVVGTGQASASVGALLGQTQKAATSMQSLTGAYNKVVVGAGKANSGISAMLGNTEKADAATRKLAGSNAYLAGSYNNVVVGTDKATQSYMTLIGVTDKARLAQEKLIRTNTNLGAGAGGKAVVGSGSGSSVTAALLGRSAIPKSTAEMKKLDAETKKVTTSTNKLEKAQMDWGKSAKYAIGGVARSLGAMTYSYAMLGPLIAGMAAGGAIKKVYELGAAFEYTTTYVDALADSMSTMSQSSISSGLLDLDGLRKGPQELAEGMKEFAKAGDDAAMSLQHIGEMSKFATIAEIGLGQASSLVIGQTKAFGNSYTETANMISAASLSSATSIEEMGSAMSYTTELATVSKIKFNEVATAMAIMANAGIRGSKAGTALRTSVLKMQAPSEKLKKQLDALGISWSAFTEEGQVKNLRTMFTELKKATDQLPDAQRISILKELFGLRALKGGANVLNSMGQEWDNLNKKIVESTDGVTFISQTYEKLGNTVTAKLELLGAEFQKALIESFDSESVQGMLEDLTDVVASDAFINSLKSTIGAINAIAGGITNLVSVVSSIPADIVDVGLVAYAIYGKSPAGRVTAGLLLVDKAVGSIKDKLLAMRASSVGDDIEELMEQGLKSTGAARDKILDEIRELETKQAYLTTPKELILKSSTKSDLLKNLGIEELLATEQKLKFDVEVGYSGAESEIDRIAEDLRNNLNHAIQIDDAFMISEGKDAIMAFKQGLDVESLDQSFDFIDEGQFTSVFSAWENARQNVQEEIDKINLAVQIKDANTYEKGLIAIEQKWKNINKVREKAKKEPLSDSDIEKLKAKELLDYTNTAAKELKKVSDSVDFSNSVAGLERSSKLSDQLTASILKAQKTAFEKVKEMKGVTGTWDAPKFSDAGVEAYFKKVLAGALDAEGAIKKMKDEIKKTNEEMNDMEFGLKLDMLDDKGKLKAINNKVDDLVRLSKAAGEAGIDGREKEIKLLEKARDLVLQINTSQKAVSRDQAQAAYDKYASAYKSRRGWVNKSDPELAKLKKESDRLSGLYYKKEADPQAEKAAQKAQLEKVQSLNKAIREAQKARLEEAQTMITDAGVDFSTTILDAARKFPEIIAGGTGGVEKGKAAVAKACPETDKMIGQTIDQAKEAQVRLNTERQRGLGISKEQQLLEAQAAAEKTRQASGINQRSEGEGFIGVTSAGIGEMNEWGTTFVMQVETVKAASLDGQRVLEDYYSGISSAVKKANDEIIVMNSETVDSFYNLTLPEGMEDKISVDLEYVFGDVDAAADKLVSTARDASQKVGQELEKAKPQPIDPEILTPFLNKLKEVKSNFDGASFEGTLFDDIWGEATEADIRAVAAAMGDSEQSVAKVVEMLKKQVEETKGLEDVSDDAMTTLSKGAGEAKDDIDILTVSLNKASTAASKIKLPTGSAEPRALGGPVTAGNTYMVGEVGPELFTPKSSGYIVPNDRLTGSAVSKDTVNINLAINGSEPIELQGSQQSVDQLQKAFDKQRRYAG